MCASKNINRFVLSLGFFSLICIFSHDAHALTSIGSSKQGEITVNQEECDFDDNFQSETSKSIEPLDNTLDLSLDIDEQIIMSDQELISQALVILEQLESEGRYSYCNFVAATHEFEQSMDPRWKIISKQLKRLRIILKERFSRITSLQCDIDLLKAFLSCMENRHNPEGFESSCAFCFSHVLANLPRSCV